MSYLVNRLREPSSWLGLAMLASQFAAAVANKDPAAIGAAVAGAAAFVLPDPKKVQ